MSRIEQSQSTKQRATARLTLARQPAILLHVQHVPCFPWPYSPRLDSPRLYLLRRYLLEMAHLLPAYMYSTCCVGRRAYISPISPLCLRYISPISPLLHVQHVRRGQCTQGREQPRRERSPPRAQRARSPTADERHVRRWLGSGLAG